MPIPEFIVELRRHVGTMPLWLPGCAAIILRDAPAEPEAGDGGAPAGGGAAPGGPRGQQVLLTLRKDLHVWAPVAGIVEPGEEPHLTAVREALEEAGVVVEVESLAWVSVGELVSYPNGDQCQFLDHTFRCRWVSGEPHVADDENLDVRWWPADALPEGMRPKDLERIRVATSNPARTLLGSDPLGRHE